MNPITLNLPHRKTRIIPLPNVAHKHLCDTLVVKGKKQWDFIPHHEIMFCRADGNYCFVHTINGQIFLVSKSLKQVEVELPSTHFLRVHQSYVVALSKIRTLTTSMCITMSDESVIPMSRRKKSQVFIKLGLRE